MERLKAWMSEHSVNQVQLAAALKVSQATISDWLNSETFPRPKKLLRLAEHTGIPVADLLVGMARRKSKAN